MNAENTDPCAIKFKIQKRTAMQGTSFGALEFDVKNVMKFKNVNLFFVKEAKEAQKNF